ncbi:ABC transporter substrate-binding protein [Virgibacillus sp. MSJ-26]|uniref:ABC transporter substrate-binding protein n=1 Tax=Virgibacillus sp. MSJ-26 TaxID=2841522 RepID=UPI00209E3F39|nr:ABC transporter substrate-binding protein [Virgibacillus sp. MSJ-26]
MKKRLQVMGIILLSMLVLLACDSDEASGDGNKFKIGVTQFVEHPSLDRAYEGFQDALADAEVEVEYDYQNAQGDQNNVKPIADNFVADGVDLIFANATPSAQSAKNATGDIPIVFTSVTDAVGAELVEDMDAAGENITGVVDLHPDAIKETVNFIDKYFNNATVGLVYNSGEQNSVAQIEAVQEAAENTNLEFTERTVSTSAEVQQATSTIVDEADVIYIITDNTVVSALDSVVGVANDQEIPLIVGEPDSLAKGGFATYGIDYYSIGYRTGEMAVDILTDEDSPEDMSVEYPPEIEMFINKEAAEEQGIEWDEDWDDAEFVETESE